jgi:hypothetical protein
VFLAKKVDRKQKTNFPTLNPLDSPEYSPYLNWMINKRLKNDKGNPNKTIPK